MLQFLQPIWLWASAAIIIPVLIHLWNVKQGKTLKVGSIALFTKSAASHARSLRITDWLLLLLRCLLIITLAMLLAKPFWKQYSVAKEKGWILMEKGNVREAYKAYGPTIDTLLKEGYAFHYFDENFEPADLKKVLDKGADTSQPSSLSYWTLLTLLDQKTPSGFPLHLFTGNRLQRFEGTRPDVSLRFTWHTFPSGDTAAAWMEKAYITSKDSIQIISGKSNSFGTVYTHENIAQNNSNIHYTVSHQNRKTVIAGTNSPQQSVEVDTTSLSIAIYANGFADDANYLKAALTAIRDITQKKMTVMITENKESIPANTDWIFWLSNDIIPSFKQKTHILVYETGKQTNIHSFVVAKDEDELTASQNIRLYKYIKVRSSDQKVWKTSSGEPILAKQNNTSIYHFYSRFSPQWSDLVWSSSFPQLLYDLIFDEPHLANKTKAEDKRIIDSSQMQPVMISGKYVSNNNEIFSKTDLSIWLWSFAFLLFFTERILSFRKQNKLA